MNSTLKKLTDQFLKQEELLRQGGDKARQKKLHRLTARERIASLLDDPCDFFELGLWAAFEMYPEWGDLPAAGCITGIGKISGKRCLIVANDATVKAGAMFPSR